ncbi:MAG: hypothetical protein JWO65_2548 [Sphingomonas bacterium]|jgi:hypothetical protein|nr:hypothetical protein [Sphingomonas bacterium]
MSRAININATQAHVIDMCAKHKAAISVVEALYSGGTRLVLKNAADAATVAKAYGNKVLTGTVTRMPTRMR